MALVQYGAGVVQFSGSIAGDTHARNRFGNYIRPRTKPVDPKSARQMAARLLVIMLAEQWREDPMTDVIRGVWDTYAAAVAMQNRLGQEVRLTGFNHFIRSNCARIAAGLELVTAGPTNLGLPSADPTFEVAASEASGELSVTFDNTKPWGDEDEAALSVEMHIPQSASRNFFGGPWRNAGAILGVTGTPPTSPAVLDAPFSLVEGQKTRCRARIIRADGRASTFFSAAPFVVGA